MQIASFTPARAQTDVPTGPASKPEAAKALIAVPMGIMMTATMAAMPKQMSGQPASRAELVAGLVAKLSPEQARMTMLNAIDGAVALMPEARIDVASLRQAADGVAALLADAAADQTQSPVADALTKITTPLEQASAPLMQLALLLDPTLAKPKG